MIILYSDRLCNKLPGLGNAPNTSHQFDRADFVSEIAINGMISFFTSKPKNLCHPFFGELGLCNKYRFNFCENLEIGEYFPKFEIGLFRKEEEGCYIFYKCYQDVIYFKINFEYISNGAYFVTEPISCQHFSLCTTQTIDIPGQYLIMTVKAENTSVRGLVLDEVYHNFISIDRIAIGAGYQLDLPQCPDLRYEQVKNRSEEHPGSLRKNGKGSTFCEYSAIDTDNAVNLNEVENVNPFTWNLLHNRARVTLYSEEGFKLLKVVIWVVDHTVCPEIVNEFFLRSGETHEWARIWTIDSY